MCDQRVEIGKSTTHLRTKSISALVSVRFKSRNERNVGYIYKIDDSYI